MRRNGMRQLISCEIDDARGHEADHVHAGSSRGNPQLERVCRGIRLRSGYAADHLPDDRAAHGECSDVRDRQSNTRHQLSGGNIHTL